MHNEKNIHIITKNTSLELILSELIKNAFPSSSIRSHKSYLFLKENTNVSILIIDHQSITEPASSCITPQDCSFPWLIINYKKTVSLPYQWAEKGYSGAIEDRHSIQLLTKAITNILDGELWFSRKILSQTLKTVLEKPYNVTALSNTIADKYELTPKEVLTCELLIQGFNNQEISLKCHISINTV